MVRSGACLRAAESRAIEPGPTQLISPTMRWPLSASEPRTTVPTNSCPSTSGKVHVTAEDFQIGRANPGQIDADEDFVRPESGIRIIIAQGNFARFGLVDQQRSHKRLLLISRVRSGPARF